MARNRKAIDTATIELAKKVKAEVQKLLPANCRFGTASVKSGAVIGIISEDETFAGLNLLAFRHPNVTVKLARAYRTEETKDGKSSFVIPCDVHPERTGTAGRTADTETVSNFVSALTGSAEMQTQFSNFGITEFCSEFRAWCKANKG